MSQQPPWETQVGKPQQQPGWGGPQQQPGGGNQNPQGQPPTPPQGRPPYQPPPPPPGGQQGQPGPPPMPQYGRQQPPPPPYYPPPPSQQGGSPQFPQGPGQQFPQGPGQQFPQGAQDPHNPMTIIPPPPQFSQTPYGQPLTGFDPTDPKKKSRKGRRIAIIATAGVLIAGVAVVGVLAMQGKDKSSGNGPAATTPTNAATSNFPGNTYASTAAGGAVDPKTLDSATTDKTPFTADGLIRPMFVDTKNVTYTLQSSGPHPCDKVGDPKVAKIITSAKCNQFFAASWTDKANRIVVSAMVVPYDDLATAKNMETQLGTASTGDYAQWCPADGPAAATCAKLTSAAGREGKFGAFHRYMVITTAVYADLRPGDAQKDWLTAAADGAYQATLPNVPNQ